MREIPLSMQPFTEETANRRLAIWLHQMRREQRIGRRLHLLLKPSRRYPVPITPEFFRCVRY